MPLKEERKSVQKINPSQGYLQVQGVSNQRKVQAKVRTQKSKDSDEESYLPSEDPRPRQRPKARPSISNLASASKRIEHFHGNKDDAKKFKNMAEITFIEERRKRIFSSRLEFERDMLSHLNRLNERDDFYSWKASPKYIIIKCNHCHNFQIWYTFK